MLSLSSEFTMFFFFLCTWNRYAYDAWVTVDLFFSFFPPFFFYPFAYNAITFECIRLFVCKLTRSNFNSVAQAQIVRREVILFAATVQQRLAFNCFLPRTWCICIHLPITTSGSRRNVSLRKFIHVNSNQIISSRQIDEWCCAWKITHCIDNLSTAQLLRILFKWKYEQKLLYTLYTLSLCIFLDRALLKLNRISVTYLYIFRWYFIESNFWLHFTICIHEENQTRYRGKWQRRNDSCKRLKKKRKKKNDNI